MTVSTVATTTLSAAGAPGIGSWPGPRTVVLTDRPLVGGTDPARLSCFADDWWDLNPAVFEHHQRSASLNFALIPAALRQDAKLYIWFLINRGRALRGGQESRLSIQSIRTLFTCYLRFVLQWFADHGVTRLNQVSPDLLWDYLRSLEVENVPYDRRYRLINEVRRLWQHRDVLPEHMQLPQAPPWGGEDSRDLLGRTRGDRENRTRRIGEETMQMLLAWAMRFVEDFSDDVLAAWSDHQRWLARGAHLRPRRDARASRHEPGALAPKIRTYLEDLRRSGGSLPGYRDEGGQLQIRWGHLSLMFDCASSLEHTTTGALIQNSGLPIGETTWLPTPITGMLDGRPWRDPGIEYKQAHMFARLLSTACFVVVSYLSGARVGEVLNLRRGCVRHDKGTGLWLMDGLYFKGAEDEHGNKIPEGQLRPDPWVIIEPVVKAVSVLERLHTSPLLFPNHLKPHLTRQANSLRQGQARSDRVMATDLAAFVEWINAECSRLGRRDAIPDDGKPLAPIRLRRTLAWFIRRRPRGLIAASIQYGHAHVRMTQGYAGSYASGFPDEYAFEDYLFRLDTLAEDEKSLVDGERVSGPAADNYRFRVSAANKEFAGRVIIGERRVRDLLGNPLLQIHHGEGMTCVFNPVTAACQIRGSADDSMVTPDIDDCRPKCPNIARTDRDIAWIEQRAAEIEDIVADPLAPPIRHARERSELDRLLKIIAGHETDGACR
ncbi:hypothetical protein KGQ19_01470 [Catenulispora sp. NL8]|uniref:Integrase n=1 Tax=Catenulispora pinistramenti TaxID=2705254 RepID=A0ABS5KI02_9ACTN|nr:hypothetical protein [Catenulispora pinistramenti]MBS2545530.1 hypothetical protein [Catenulispora pinistramenti]